MTGAQFHAMTKFGSPLYRDLAGKDPDLSHYASEIKGALDDAWGQALPPDKLAAWTQAKQQYKNIMTLKPAIDETTQQADPNLLYRSVERKNRGSTANAGDLGTLAEGGVNFLRAAYGQRSEARRPHWDDRRWGAGTRRRACRAADWSPRSFSIPWRPARQRRTGWETWARAR